MRNPCAGFELHLQHRFFRPAGPEVNRVDRVIGRLHADVSQRDLDVSGADFVLDESSVCSAICFGALDARSRRRVQAQSRTGRHRRSEKSRAQNCRPETIITPRQRR